MSKKIKFGEINEIPLRSMFPGEGTDFTPWLSDNIDILGNIIGIDIIDAEKEVRIGDFLLDIQAAESDTGRVIAIENQFETTDHRHLGQLITYMAGIDASVVVWIAEEFRNEHISAINHLNQISNKDVSFFCIKPRIIKIGDSDPSFEFSVVAKPDDWEKKVKVSGAKLIGIEEFMKSLDIQGKTFFKGLFDFSTKNGILISWGKVGFALTVNVDGKNVSILRGFPQRSNSNQFVTTTFGFIEKYVQNGEFVVATYRKGLPFFQSTGPNLKWIIKDTSKEEETEFYRVMLQVIELMRSNGLKQD